MKLQIVLLTLWMGINAAWAQQTDSLGNVNFNALEHVLQDRYVPARKVIDPKDKKGRTRLGLYGGISHLILGSPATPGSTDFGVSFTRSYHPLHSWRIAATYSRATRGYDEGMGHQHRYGIEASDLFDVLDFLQGYRANRWTDVKTVVGLGTYYSDPSRGKGKFSVGLHAGLHFSHAIYDHLTLFLEPRATLFTDGYDAKTGLKSSRGYHTGVQMLVGTTYIFRSLGLPALRMEDMYFEYYAGIQGDYSDRVSKHFEEDSGRFGPNFGLGIGKWYLPFGYRFTLFTGYHYVPKEALVDKTTNFLFGLRAEAMLNLNKLICPKALNPRVEINAGGGYETTLIMHDREGVLKHSHLFAHGATISTQLLYRLNPTYGIFLQGRYSRLNYTEKFKDDSESERHKRNYSLELGLQYRRNPHEAKKYNKQFRPSTFIELAAGINATVDSKNSASLGNILKSDLLGSQAGFRVGRQFSPYSTLRASLETGFMNIGKGEKAYPTTFAVDYMIDFTTLFTRYRADRLFTFTPYIGLVYSHHNRGTFKHDTRITTMNGNYIGISIGLNEYFRINERWGMYVEEAVRVYKGKYNAGAPTYTQLDLNSVLNCNIGLRYRF